MNNKRILETLFFNSEFLERIYNFKFSKFYEDRIQKGGAKIKFEYGDYTIKFNKEVETDRIIILLSSQDKNHNCITIIIDKEEKIATIQGLSVNPEKSCYLPMEMNKGKIYLELAILMLKENKDNFKIKKIRLTDNSFIYCRYIYKLNLAQYPIKILRYKSGKRIRSIPFKLADLSFLQHCETFYGRWGFKLENKYLRDEYRKLKKVYKKMSVKDIGLKKFIKENKKLNNLDILDYKDKDEKLRRWFKRVSKKLKNNCELFDKLIKFLIIKTGLQSFHGGVYIMRLKSN